ncbi:hypothetical protein [Sphingobacterium siyangense]
MNDFLQAFAMSFSFAAGVLVGMLAVIGALLMFRNSKSKVK